jgi:hypothetical protein
MKIEAKHVLGAVVVMGLTALFRNELTREFRRHGWL